MKRLSRTKRHPGRWLAAIVLTSSLVACGGGGGSGTTSAQSLAASTLTGRAIDAAVPNATVTITSGAPLGDPGAASIGSFTTDSTGAYSGSVTLPSASVPVFANVSASVINNVNQASSTLSMSSYIGQSTTLAAMGAFTSVSTTGAVANLPNLDITPVTSAALAVYAYNNAGSFAALTPTGYASTLQADGSAILAIASGIKAIGDGYCALPSSVNGTVLTSTTDFANAVTALLGTAGLSNGTALTQVSQQLNSCVNGFSLTSVSQVIDADAVFGPQLALGDVIEPALGTAQPLTTGNYQLQYQTVETGATVTPLTYASAALPAPYQPTSMPIVSIASSGAMTTNDSSLSGSALGNVISFTMTANGHSYAMTGKVGAMPAALYTATAGNVFTIQANGVDNSTSPARLLKLSGVLVPWNGTATTAAPVFTTALSSSGGHGITCASGQLPLRMDLMTTAALNAVQTSLGGSIAECLTSSATSPNWTLTAGTSSQATSYEFDRHSGVSTAVTLGTPLNLTPASSATSFILQGSGTVSMTSGSTSVFNNAAAAFSYVFGTGDMVFAINSGGVQSNGLLHLQDAVQTSEYASTVSIQASESSGIFFNTAGSGYGDHYDH